MSNVFVLPTVDISCYPDSLPCLDDDAANPSDNNASEDFPSNPNSVRLTNVSSPKNVQSIFRLVLI